MSSTKHNWVCPVCDINAQVPVWPVHCACGFVQYKASPGLGDRTAAFLSRRGVTRARYLAAKKALHLKRKCNCPERQQKLNALGSMFFAWYYNAKYLLFRFTKFG